MNSNIKLYMLPGRIGLKFDNSPARDEFWNAMNDSARAVAERIATRTIRFHVERVKDPNGMVIPICGNGAVPVVNKPVPVAQTAQPQPAAPIPQPGIVTVGAGGDPFALTGNAVKTLPGLVAVASNMPPGMPEEPSQAVQTPTGPENAPTGKENAQEVATGTSEPAPEPAKPADDPEPKDRRTAAWKKWRARNP